MRAPRGGQVGEEINNIYFSESSFFLHFDGSQAQGGGNRGTGQRSKQSQVLYVNLYQS